MVVNLDHYRTYEQLGIGMLGLRADVKFLRREILWMIAKHKQDGLTINAMAKRLECDRNSVLNHIKALQNSDHIRVKSGRGRSCSDYEILQAGKTVLNDFVEDVLNHVGSI